MRIATTWPQNSDFHPIVPVSIGSGAKLPRIRMENIWQTSFPKGIDKGSPQQDNTPRSGAV
jgi:hypothetical protein